MIVFNNNGVFSFMTLSQIGKFVLFFFLVVVYNNKNLNGISYNILSKNHFFFVLNGLNMYATVCVIEQ